AYLDDALAALPEPLQAQAVQHLEALTPVRPAAATGEPFDTGTTLETAHFSVRFAPNGSITGLTERATGRQWADDAHPLMVYGFEAFSHLDYARFFEQYVGDKPDILDWSVPDFTKPGLERAVEQHFAWQAGAGRAVARSLPSGPQVTFTLTTPDDIVRH